MIKFGVSNEETSCKSWPEWVLKEKENTWGAILVVLELLQLSPCVMITHILEIISKPG